MINSAVIGQLIKVNKINTSNSSTPSSIIPTDITGLKAWWKADSLSLNDGDPVDTWSTSGGPARDATATTTHRPTYKTNIQNGKPILRFDSTNQQQLIYTTEDLPSFTVFIVFSILAPLGGSSYAGPLNWRTASENGFQIVNDIATANYASHLVIWNGTTETANKVGETQSYPRPIHLIEWTSTPTHYRNAANISISDGATGFSDIGGLIGKAFGWVDADIAEIIVYNSVLSVGNRQGIETYLNTRWAIY